MVNSIHAPEVDAVLQGAKAPSHRDVHVGGDVRRIPVPFPSSQDWRDVWIYQLLVDRFNNPNAGPKNQWDDTREEFKGGTLNGVRDKLDYLQELGVGAIWLSPVQMNSFYKQSYHGYGIHNFLRIDPRLASDIDAARANPGLVEQELRDLIDAAHARNMYVVFDVVLNHVGDVFEYVHEDGSTAAKAPFRDHPYPIRWRGPDGQGRADWPEASTITQVPADALVWPQELQNNVYFRRQGEKGPEPYGDFDILKELATEQSELLRNTLIRVHQYLIGKFDVDGFRIDTLKHVEPEFARVFGNAVREYALSIGKRNFFSFGEVADNEDTIARYIGRNATSESDLLGVDAALDFPLHHVLPSVAKGLLAPAELNRVFEYRKEKHKGLLSSHGEASRFFVTFCDNHDMHKRLHHVDAFDPQRFDDQVTLAVAALFTLQGIPCLYYGTEQGLDGEGNSFEAVREALWGMPGAFNQHHPYYQAIQQLSMIREQHPTVRYGRQYFRPVSGNGQDYGISSSAGGVLAFSRILNDTEILVAANTNTENAWTGHIIVDRSLNPAGTIYADLFTNKPDPNHDAPVQVEAERTSVVLTMKPMEIRVLRRTR